MGHTQKDKPHLLARIRRLQGQLEGLRKAVEADQGCDEVLHTLAAFRGAINGLMLEVLEGHIRHHVMGHDDDAGKESHDPIDAAEQLIDVLRKYLR